MAIFNDGDQAAPPPNRQFVQKARPFTLIGIPSNAMGDKAVIKHSNGVDGILAKLFNIVCLDISNDAGISPIQWNRLTNDYIQLVIGNGSLIDRMSIRGNLNKALRKPKMTWDVFYTGLLFLKYRAFKITVAYKDAAGQIQQADYNVHFLCKEDLMMIVPQERLSFYSGALSRQELEADVRTHTGKKPYSYRTDKVLSSLFEQIRKQVIPNDDSLGSGWKKYITQYVEGDETAPTKKKKTHRRGNVAKAVRKDKISWKRFCEGLQILNITDFSVVINGVRVDSREYESIIQVSFAMNNGAGGSNDDDNDNDE